MLFAKTRSLALALVGAVGLTVAGAALSAGAMPTVYYVSTAGSDSAAGDSAHPFRHIQRCATVMVAGDDCIIATGTYRETVTPAHSGTSSARITYQAAPGATVTIDGTDPVTGWSAVSGSDLAALEAADANLSASPFASAVAGGTVYRASVSLNSSLPGNQVFSDGSAQVEAQWPYPGTDPLSPAFQWSQGGSANSVSDSALTQPAGYWVGARLSASNWFESGTGTVTASAVGSVTASAFPACVSLAPVSGQTATHYSLSGRLEELGHAGEWFYDSHASRLYVWSPDGSSPAGHTIEAKQRAVGIDLSGVDYTSLVGLGVRATSVTTSAGSNNDLIDHLTARYVSSYMDLAPDPGMVTTPDGCAVLSAGETTSGIQLAGSANTFTNGTISGSSGNGIVVSGSGNTVTNSTIANVDSGGTYAAGINVLGSNHLISHNTVRNVGRSDLNIDNKVAGSTASGTRIEYNDFSGYDRLVTDGGAIYICCQVNLAGTTVHHNLLHDAAVPAGNYPNAFTETGAYFDNGTYNVTAYDNVGWNNPTGTVAINSDSFGSSGNIIDNTTNAYGSGKAVSLYGAFSSSQVTNSIGTVDTPGGVTVSNTLPGSTDPLFVNPSAHDYRLQASSPARNAGALRSPATDGYIDPAPSEGAYQYGVAPWSAGAVTAAAGAIQAEDYTSSSGVARASGGTGTVVGSFDGGDWYGFSAVDFGTGSDTFTASIADDPAYAGQHFEIHIDGLTGPTIGTATVASTGGFTTFASQSIPITPTSGVHSLYLVGLGSFYGIADLDYFQLTSSSAPPAPLTVQAESYSSSSGVSVMSGGTGSYVGSFDRGDWFAFGSVDFGAGRSTFTASLAVNTPYAGQQFEIRLGSTTGTLIGTVTVASTGGWSTFASQSTAITTTTGVHDVYLVGGGSGTGIGNLDYFTIS